MKILSKISMFLVGAAALVSCNGPEKTLVDPADMKPAVITAYPTENMVLDRSQPDATAMTIKWDAAQYGYKASITYTIYAQITVDGAVSMAEIAQTTKTEIAITNKALNGPLVKVLKAPVDEPYAFEIVIRSTIGDPRYETPSAKVDMSATPYSMDPVPFWVIGNYCGWSHDKATHIYSDLANNIYTGWVAMFDGDGATTPFKFCPAASWDVAYGGSLEALSTSGGDINIENGNVKLFTLNIPNLKASVDKTFKRLGMVGDASPNGWDSPDTELVYDKENNYFKATGVAMKAGGFKFRCDDDWKVCDWGATDTPGRLTRTGGGGNITFDKADGTYTVIVRLFDAYPTYELIAE